MIGKLIFTIDDAKESFDYLLEVGEQNGRCSDDVFQEYKKHLMEYERTHGYSSCICIDKWEEQINYAVGKTTRWIFEK